MSGTDQEPPSLLREKVEAARLIVRAVEGLPLLAEATALPFLAYLIRMVEAEAATVIASGNNKVSSPN